MKEREKERGPTKIRDHRSGGDRHAHLRLYRLYFEVKGDEGEDQTLGWDE